MKLSQIKNLLTSNENINHILSYIEIDPQTKEEYIPTLHKILENIFQQNIPQLRECSTRNDIENILNTCNKTSIVTITDIIQRESQLKDLYTKNKTIYTKDIIDTNNILDTNNPNNPIDTNNLTNTPNINNPTNIPDINNTIENTIKDTLIQLLDTKLTQKENIQEKGFSTLHLYSTDAEYNKCTYKYEYNLKNVSSILLKSFKLKCNMYNINESNNKFYITHNSKKYDIFIPFGYYNIVNLTECMNNAIDQVIDLNIECDIYYNNIKNRIYIESDENINIMFSGELNKLLGFSKLEYSNNNRYISETDHFTNIFDDFYIKLFINDKEIIKNISNRKFNYYEYIFLDFDNDFGKSIYTKFENDYFDFKESINIHNISLQLYTNNTQFNLVNKYIDYDFIITFEYLQ